MTPHFRLTGGALTLPEGPQDLPVGWQRAPRAGPALDSQKGSAQQVLLLLLPSSEGLRPPSCHGLYPIDRCCAWWGNPQWCLYSVKSGQVSFVLPVPSQGLLGEMQLPGMEVWGAPGQRCQALAARSSL